MSIFIIAEIGINHNGDLGITKQLIDVAVNAGTDAVKFQKRTIDLVYDKEMLDGPAKARGARPSANRKKGWNSAPTITKRSTATARTRGSSGLRPPGTWKARSFSASSASSTTKSRLR